MLKLGSIVLLLFVAQTNGCAPGTGSLGTKATFDFVMVPPIMYTYCGGCDYVEYGQWMDETYAKNVVKSDVQNAINAVLQANSIPTNDINAPVVTYTPKNITLAPPGTNCTQENQGIIVDKIVQYICEKKEEEYGTVTCTVDLSVQITAVQSIYQSQWNALANQVEEKLSAKSGAVFVVDPIVTVTN